MFNTCVNTPSVATSSEHEILFDRRCIWVNGPVIVGAGPSGLAAAASLKKQGVPFIILERANCIASLWQNCTYDRLKLHLPKQFCQLPNFPFPDYFPEYPEFEGLEEFGGHVRHACDYKSGESYQGKQVLVVGCGNSGMEVSLDLT